jgi:hypothetical protein
MYDFTYIEETFLQNPFRADDQTHVASRQIYLFVFRLDLVYNGAAQVVLSKEKYCIYLNEAQLGACFMYMSTYTDRVKAKENKRLVQEQIRFFHLIYSRAF